MLYLKDARLADSKLVNLLKILSLIALTFCTQIVGLRLVYTVVISFMPDDFPLISSTL